MAEQMMSFSSDEIVFERDDSCERWPMKRVVVGLIRVSLVTVLGMLEVGTDARQRERINSGRSSSLVFNS